ncbi:MAG: hypothetical protein L0H31_00740 [Nocardioidaceae bacterium]|nr:hypothetical protein [Nocardioidaceae bacterium]
MPERVRVTGPPRHATARSTANRWGDVHEQTPLGDLYLRSLLREQLGLAARMLATATVGLGVVPLVFYLWPDLSEVTMFGVPLAWLLLGVVTYPFLLLLAWRYVRRAERNEHVFADLVGSDADPAEEGHQR